MAVITLNNLTKRFGEVVANNSIDLKIEDGDVVALLGPSGCGKTTLLLLLAGIYKPSEGEILFDDKVVNKMKPKLRNVGLVFQSYALYPHMTVYENIAFPLKLQKVNSEIIKKRIEQVTEKVQIGNLLERKPGQLSGGQQQRVALCRALVKEPSILLLDEPLSNLDARLRIETRAEISRLQKELGITTVYVTHDQSEAMSVADKVAVMKKGEIQQYAEPDELYEHPQNIFVGSFIGDPPMNLIDVELQKNNGKEVLYGNEALRFPVNEEIKDKVKDKKNEALIMGVRPENVHIGNEKGFLSFAGEIYMKENFGREILLNVSLDGKNIKALTSKDKDFKIGNEIEICFKREHLHFFDSKEEDVSALIQ